MMKSRMVRMAAPWGLLLTLVACSLDDGDLTLRGGEPHDGKSAEHETDKGYETEGDTEHEHKADGCVSTQGYWKNHHADARNPNQTIPWPLPEDTVLCERSWLEWLHTPPRGGDAWIILVRQWIAAQLNVASGAAVPQGVADAISDADALLASCSVSGSDRSEALALSEFLDAYNNGNEGVPSCDGKHGPGRGKGRGHGDTPCDD
jgi:hypothetical protein